MEFLKCLTVEGSSWRVAVCYASREGGVSRSSWDPRGRCSGIAWSVLSPRRLHAQISETRAALDMDASRKLCPVHLSFISRSGEADTRLHVPETTLLLPPHMRKLCLEKSTTW